MKNSALLKTTGLLLGLVAGAYLLQSEPQTQTSACMTFVLNGEQGFDYQQQCPAAPQQSWLAWFSGQSRSTQFHFIDLLELLNRFKH